MNKMTSVKKAQLILLIIVGVILQAVGALALYIVYSFTLWPETFFAELSARGRAREYWREKYGEEVVITDAEAFLTGGGWFGGPLRIECVRVTTKDGSVIAVSDEYSCDDAQYDEITAAFTAAFLEDASLGTARDIYVSLRLNDHYDTNDFDRFTDVYFDGDLTAFFDDVCPECYITAEYDGEAEAAGTYPDAIGKKLSELLELDAKSLKAYITVKNPALELPEMPGKFVNSHKIMREPYAEEFLETFAYGNAEKSRDDMTLQVFAVNFYDIDEYTAVSDNLYGSPVTSQRDYVFEPTDLSEETTAYRGKYKYDDHAEKNIMTIRNEGWRIDFPNRRDLLFRLDREHYGITENTLPLVVTDVLTNTAWAGKRLYVSLGVDGFDPSEDSWYYLDDKYLYLYINNPIHDLYGFSSGYYLTFADLPDCLRDPDDIIL